MYKRHFNLKRIFRSSILFIGMCICVYAAGYFSGELIVDATEQKSVHITESIQVADKVPDVADAEPPHTRSF